MDTTAFITPAVLASISSAGSVRLAQYIAPLNAAMSQFLINTSARAAMFLAEVACESNGFRCVEEDLDYSASELLATFKKHFEPAEIAEYGRKPEAIANRVYANRMGNGDEASGDGWRYHGRGLLQLTGRKNYSACMYGIGVALLDRPELLALPVNAALSSAWFWHTNDLNHLADAGQFTKITEVINGGQNGVKQRLQYWRRAKAALGVEV